MVAHILPDLSNKGNLLGKAVWLHLEQVRMYSFWRVFWELFFKLAPSFKQWRNGKSGQYRGELRFGTKSSISKLSAFIWSLELVKVEPDSIDTVLKRVHVFLVFLFGAHEEWGFHLVAWQEIWFFYSIMLGTVETKLNRKRSLHLVTNFLIYPRSGMR